MRKSGSRLWLCMAVVFAAVLYTCLLLLIKPAMDMTSWTLYAFTIASLLMLVIQLIFGAGGVKPMPHFDYINTGVAAVYAALQMLVGGIFLMSFSGLPLIPVLCVEAVILGAYLIFTFILSAVTSHAEAQDHNVNKALTNVRLLVTDLELMAAAQEDPALKGALQAAAKELRYQDVIVPPELAPLETQLGECVQDVRSALDDADADVNIPLKRLNALLQERKLKSRALKR